MPHGTTCPPRDPRHAFCVGSPMEDRSPLAPQHHPSDDHSGTGVQWFLGLICWLCPQPRALLPTQRCQADGCDSFGFSTLSAFLPACSELPQTRTHSNSPLKNNDKEGNRKRGEKGPEAKLKLTVKRGCFCQDTKTVATAESLFSPHQPLGSAAGLS